MKALIWLGIRSGVIVISVLIATASLTCWAGSGVPRGIFIPSRSKTHVHAHISKVRIEDYPALTNIHALYTAYFDGGATDEKLKALAQLRFTNLECVVVANSPAVTDNGIEPLSRIPTLERISLSGLSITDKSCETLVTKMHLLGIHVPDCSNVTVNGLVKLAQAETVESLSFSLGKLRQDDLIRLIITAASQLGRIDIVMNDGAESRLDLPALRKAAKAKRIRLFKIQNRVCSDM